MVQDQVVFKGALLVVAAAICREMKAGAHATHIGEAVFGVARRTQDHMFWPHITRNFKEYISKCDICLAHRWLIVHHLGKSHCFSMSLWGVDGPRCAEPCELQGHTLLMVCDYLSNFIEVERTNKSTTHGVTKALQTMFARYGTPDVSISNNGPQFDSGEFATFAKTWTF